MIKDRIGKAGVQLSYMIYDLSLIVNTRWWRWLTCWFGGCTGVHVAYRIDRFFYLLLGQSWGVIRIAFFPFFLFWRVLSTKYEIHYMADIGKGLRILHPSLGVVINGNAIIGDHLILTGGNCIGGKKKLNRGDIWIGNHVSLGANAVVLGPIQIGNQVTIGAGAVVVDNFEDGVTVAGVPARIVRRSTGDQEDSEIQQ